MTELADALASKTTDSMVRQAYKASLLNDGMRASRDQAPEQYHAKQIIVFDDRFATNAVACLTHLNTLAAIKRFGLFS